MKRILMPFYMTALWILERIPEKQWNKKRGEERLRALYPGKAYSMKEYSAGKLALVLAVLFWGMGAAIFAELTLGREANNVSGTTLSRPEYGEGTRETQLEAFVDGQNEGTLFSISIQEREYTAEEIQDIFEDVMDGLDKEILGENESLDEVRSSLSLPSTLYGGIVAVEWIISPADVMDSSGAILKDTDEEGELVELRALLSYRGWEAEYICYANVRPAELTEEESLEKELQEKIRQADEAGIYESIIELPREAGGRKISWAEPAVHVGAPLAVLVLIGAVFIWYRQEEELAKRERERKRQLVIDYPEVLFKMAMLLGAGMTLKGTFQKITAEYRKRRERRPRYVYEEMLLACREMENGVGEADAYESFGRRCGDPRYVKLGSALSQNLKKGAKGLQDLLEREAAAGFEERKNEARKMGEEAGTRLLIPMMLMLALVMAILVVPAALNF